MRFKRLVAESYDAIAERLASQAYDSDHVTRWLGELSETLPRSARVLDLGSGTGEPHTAWLAERFEVTADSHRSLELFTQAGFDVVGASVEADTLDTESDDSGLSAGADTWRIGSGHLFVLGVKPDRSP